MNTLAIFYQTLALAGAIGSLIGGVSSVIVIWERRLYTKKSEKNVQKGEVMKKSYIISKIIVGCGLIAFSSYLFSMLAFGQPEYRNQKLVAEAWHALNEKQYEIAIEVAKECIVEFRSDAFKEQEKLDSANEPSPPVGKTSANIKNEILRRGLLNDVAACWYIIGVSEMKLKNNEKAVGAFKKLRQFSYARIYDPEWDGFWSPSEKAESYIQSLGGKLY